MKYTLKEVIEFTNYVLNRQESEHQVSDADVRNHFGDNVE